MSRNHAVIFLNYFLAILLFYINIKKLSLKAVLIFQQLNAKECPNHNTTAAFNLNNNYKKL